MFANAAKERKKEKGDREEPCVFVFSFWFWFYTFLYIFTSSPTATTALSSLSFCSSLFSNGAKLTVQYHAPTGMCRRRLRSAANQLRTRVQTKPVLFCRCLVCIFVVRSEGNNLEGLYGGTFSKKESPRW